MTRPAPRDAEVLLYQADDGRTHLEVRFDGDSAWLSLAQIAALFQRDSSVISRHLKKIFSEGELDPRAVVARAATTALDGKTYQVDYYGLDVILAVGYRVNAPRGRQFRAWATERLREYIVKGFALDDERLKRGGGGAYFDELLARIRDIRSSENVFWKKVLEIYATSIDYDPRAEASERFFKTVQNKMHWAAHGHPAAEVVALLDSLVFFWPGKENGPGDQGRAHHERYARAREPMFVFRASTAEVIAENGAPMISSCNFRAPRSHPSSGKQPRGAGAFRALSVLVPGEDVVEVVFPSRVMLPATTEVATEYEAAQGFPLF
ncbi:MAG: RhuM family protein [Minicystis sp.]